MAERKDCEHFIPIRKADLIELLCREPDLAPDDREQFRRLCEMLNATIHFEFHAKLSELTDAYACFDPDADTQAIESVVGDERERRLGVLIDKFIELLAHANFRRLSQDDVREALRSASDWGLNLDVDFDVFDRLELFARGDCVGRRSRRRWRNWWRLEEVDVPIFRRLVLILRLKKLLKLGDKVDSESVFIKLFKDIPKQDLEMLLPGTRVKMSLLDRGKIALPALSGFAITILKIIKGAVVLAVAGVYSTVAFIGLLAGTLGYGVRSFFGYLRTKEKYQLSLTQSLYYQNLDNNAGALFRLLNEAEEQECREAMLEYFLLWRRGGAAGWSRERLDDEAEAYLRRAAHIEIDFEIGDAINKLERLELVESLPGGLLRAIPAATALERLDYAWDNLFRYSAPATVDSAARRWQMARESRRACG